MWKETHGDGRSTGMNKKPLEMPFGISILIIMFSICAFSCAANAEDAIDDILNDEEETEGEWLALNEDDGGNTTMLAVSAALTVVVVCMGYFIFSRAKP